MSNALEIWPVQQMHDVGFAACEIIIQAHHVAVLLKKFFAEVTAEESSTTGDKNFFKLLPHCI